ncbi:hypothetical protein VTN31DRAFT_3789 [Thermomyces dupontii]|uniref:uncharacterized protein n=1 Tax=Talaromyces thermophilus TaxID=28565 RepID=UPI0037437E44
MLLDLLPRRQDEASHPTNVGGRVSNQATSPSSRNRASQFDPELEHTFPSRAAQSRIDRTGSRRVREVSNQATPVVHSEPALIQYAPPSRTHGATAPGNRPGTRIWTGGSGSKRNVLHQTVIELRRGYSDVGFWLYESLTTNRVTTADPQQPRQ